MEVNADFAKRASVHVADTSWVQSPMAGVERRMLDRIGGEVARATSIVRFAPGSTFSPHIHEGGEEYLVLEGVFQDEEGDFPVGSYVRNPPQTSHVPRADDGATILVKLWQFDPEDQHKINILTTEQTPEDARDRPGVQVIPLFEDAHENVRIELWAPGAEIAIPDHKGIEVFVIEGGFDEGGEAFTSYSWLRLPPGAALRAHTGPGGARVWIKSDHLARTPRAPG